MLAATNISKSYGRVQVLKDVTLAVHPGKITVLLGPSGAGKTTLLKCMGLLEHANSGSIRIDGRQFKFPLTKGQPFSPPWPELTVVFQQHFLWPHLTIRENILLPIRKRPDLSLPGFRDLIELFDMEEFIDRFPNEASLGQRQRAALARAFVLNPRFILLDEITSALDVEQIHNLFLHLTEMRRRGIGILLITHLLSFARALIEGVEGDEVVFLEDGVVVEKGGVELFDSPKSPRLKQFVSGMRFSA
jgi:ABC-type polar amino acid transport system ATPase subunit